MGKNKIQNNIDLGDLNSNFLNEAIKEKFVDIPLRENNFDDIEKEEGTIEHIISKEIITKNLT